VNGWKFITTKSSELEFEIKYLCHKAVNDNKNKISKNYFKIKDDVACTIGLHYERPVSVSFIHNRPVFNGMLRVLSRFYYDDGIHISHYENRRFVRPSTEKMLKQQIEYCSKELSCDDVFFSREDKTPHIIRRLCKAVNFKTDDNKYKVTDRHYQYIGWIGKLCLEKYHKHS
tara:strand:- start:4351 stop:4866 length:516 start_codon:yes stop_codon:yes gene_type:complete